MTEQGWGYKHKEGGRHSSQISKEAQRRRLDLADKVFGIFADRVGVWSTGINHQEKITRDKFEVLFDAIAKTVDPKIFEGNVSEFLSSNLFHIIGGAIGRPLDPEERDLLTDIIKEKFGVKD